MNFQKFSKKGFLALAAGLLMLPVVALAQGPMAVAGANNLYCAGYVQTASVNVDNKIVGAENEQDQFVYAQGQNLYVSMGANKGVQVGDVFTVVRPRGSVKTRWTNKDYLGFYVQEVGALEVIRVKNEVSVVRVKNACEMIQLGDLVQPVQQRVSPMYANRPALDLFGDPSGKAMGRIFMARDNQEMLGREQIVYVDLGADNNVQVGDYLTVFRPLGKGNLFGKDPDEVVSSRDVGYESSVYGGGRYSNQAPRVSGETSSGQVVRIVDTVKDRPAALRKVVGEAVVLNVRERTATAVITRTRQEIHTGDMVEIQ